MLFRILLVLSVPFVSLVLTSQTAYAQGIIIPRPCEIRPRCPRPRPRPRPIRLPVSLPVKSINIDTVIKGQVATTTVVQVFSNKTPYTLEGKYFFPIPEKSSIEGFSIWENGKKLVGEVRSKKEARRIYNQIVRKMKDPGLLEYAGKDLFQASIFPIPPNSDKKIELVYSQVLRAESGTVAYKYPLGTGSRVWSGTSNVRFPSRTSRKPASSTVPATVSGRITITGNAPLRNIYSPSHSLDINKKGANSASISFESKKDPSDFRLYYGLSKEEFGVSLMTYREPGKDGYFLMMISPSDQIDDRRVVDKDVIFVLDTSGSMADDGKISKAKPALRFGIQSLNEGDRYNVINFSGEEHLMDLGLVPATKSGKSKGAKFIENLKPNGGTNINDALASALKQFDSSNRPKMLVFLTDGLPTVGESNVDRIVANAKAIKVNGLRLFPFGVGYDVNTRLLDKLASENSGLADYVEPKENLEIKVSNFFSKVNSPVLTDLEIDYGTLSQSMVYPRKVTDLFKGMQMVLIGRYNNSKDLRDLAIKLRGRSGKSKKTFEYKNLAFPKLSRGNDFLPRLWASRRVGFLIEQIRANGSNKELKDEIVKLGTKYGIVTPYTSYLATDGSYVARETRGNRFMDRNPGASARKMRAESGRSAVAQSIQQNSLKSNAKASSDSAATVYLPNTVKNQFVGTKNFINDSGVWVDTDYDKSRNLSENTVKFGSNEFFVLVNKHPELARYLSIGKKIVIVWKNEVYRIVE